MRKKVPHLLGAVLLSGLILCGTFAIGLAYASNLSQMEQKMHPSRQTGTVWISQERDFYLVNRDGTLQAYVWWQNEWKTAEFSAVGARYHILLLDDRKMAGGSIYMRQPDQLRWRCDPEDAFSAGRRRIVLQRDDYEHWKDMFPFSE